jgi:hypothetical protein
LLTESTAAKAPIKVHKLRGDVSILEGSGGNIAVLTGADGKVFIDAGITASRPRILEAANGKSCRSPTSTAASREAFPSRAIIAYPGQEHQSRDQEARAPTNGHRRAVP